MTQEQRVSAKAARQMKRDQMTMLVGAIVTLSMVVFPDVPPEAGAPMTTILTIMALRGHPQT